MDREQWLADRRTGIGASDIAAVAGLSPWDTPLGVYLDKLSQLPRRPMTAAMAWGLRLERAIADAYQEETGRGFYTSALCRHEEHPWMVATPDRITMDGDRLVELKTSGSAAGWGEPGTDQVPEQYLIQCQWQMAVCGHSRADVAVLIAGHDFRVYCLERSDSVIDRLTEIGRRFWFEHVLKRQPPPPDWCHPQTLDLLERLYGVDPALEVALDEAAQKAADQYELLGAILRDRERDRRAVKARLLHAMGAAGLARLPNGRVLRRREVQRKAYAVPESSYIDLRILKPRKGAHEHDDREEG